MDDVKSIDLDAMSVQELTELQAQLHVAIRAAIRQRAELKAGTGQPKPEPKPAVIDLARERDAWLAARKR